MRTVRPLSACSLFDCYGPQEKKVLCHKKCKRCEHQIIMLRRRRRDAFLLFVAFMIMAMMISRPIGTTNALILQQNGTPLLCRLVSFVPFTYYNYTTEDWDSVYGKVNSLGYSHMAAGLLAMDHFNERNPAVVPELATEEVFGNCSIQFDLSTSRFLDTGIITHRSTSLLLQEIVNHGIPCALAGPYSDLSSQILSTFAASAAIPLVAHRAYNLRVGDVYFSPYSSVVYPDQLAVAEALVRFLEYKERYNYVAVLYGIGDTSIQFQEVVVNHLKAAHIQYKIYSYGVLYDPEGRFIDPTLEITNVLRQLKEDGYRTIVSIQEFVEYETSIISLAAEEVGLNTGDHFWIFLGTDLSVFSYSNFDLSLSNDTVGETNYTVFELSMSILRLLAGGAMLSPLEGFHVDADDKFLKAWKIQNESFVERVNAQNSIEEGQPGYYEGEPNYFRIFPPLSGAGFMYDAIMSIGMGACLASAGIAGDISGQVHEVGIRSSNFTGATGRVRMERRGEDTEEMSGRRARSSVRYGIVNLFHRFALEEESMWPEMLSFSDYVAEGSDLNLYQISDVLETGERATNGQRSWKEITPFIFRTGSTSPPLLLRTTPEQNFLSRGFRITGLVLMSIAIAACSVSGCWVFVHRHDRVVRAAQPFALHLICFGSFVMAWSILPLSFDESYGWTEEQLSKGCMSVPWLVSTGFITTYGALFVKLWRLDKVLQFRRAEVRVKHVAWPAALLFVAAIVLLSVMTAVAPLEWERVPVASDTGESIGRCSSDQFGQFIWTLALLMFIPMVLTGIMAWKTHDVDSAYSDAFWIGVLIVVQIEVAIFGIPLVTILRDVGLGILDTDGRYFGIVMILFILPASTVGLIILPKVWAQSAGYTQATRGSGGTGAVRVTGIAPENIDQRLIDSALHSSSGSPEKQPRGSNGSMEKHSLEAIDE